MGFALQCDGARRYARAIVNMQSHCMIGDRTKKIKVCRVAMLKLPIAMWYSDYLTRDCANVVFTCQNASTRADWGAKRWHCIC